MSDPFKGRTSDQRAGEMGDYFRGEDARKGDFLRRLLEAFSKPGQWIDENVVQPAFGGGAEAMPGGMPPMAGGMSPAPPMAPGGGMPAPQSAPPPLGGLPPQMATAGYSGPQSIEEARRKLQQQAPQNPNPLLQ